MVNWIALIVPTGHYLAARGAIGRWYGKVQSEQSCAAKWLAEYGADLNFASILCIVKRKILFGCARHQ